MHRHGPSCLSGPISRARRQWAQSTPGRRRKSTVDNPSPAAKDPAIRADLVERVRREIAAGTYETPEKWAIALERLLGRLEDDVVSGE